MGVLGTDERWFFLQRRVIRRMSAVFGRLFGKPKEQANTLTTLDKLNEVILFFMDLCFIRAYLMIEINLLSVFSLVQIR